jgi:hypothetical protein
MTTVYVVTAGSGDSYRIERVYLDGAHRCTGSRTTTTGLRLCCHSSTWTGSHSARQYGPS